MSMRIRLEVAQESDLSDMKNNQLYVKFYLNLVFYKCNYSMKKQSAYITMKKCLCTFMNTSNLTSGLSIYPIGSFYEEKVSAPIAPC